MRAECNSGGEHRVPACRCRQPAGNTFENSSATKRIPGCRDEQAGSLCSPNRESQDPDPSLCPPARESFRSCVLHAGRAFGGTTFVSSLILETGGRSRSLQDFVWVGRATQIPIAVLSFVRNAFQTQKLTRNQEPSRQAAEMNRLAACAPQSERSSTFRSPLCPPARESFRSCVLCARRSGKKNAGGRLLTLRHSMCSSKD